MTEEKDSKEVWEEFVDQFDDMLARQFVRDFYGKQDETTEGSTPTPFRRPTNGDR